VRLSLGIKGDDAPAKPDSTRKRNEMMPPQKFAVGASLIKLVNMDFSSLVLKAR
jgi:hypothetical protein